MTTTQEQQRTNKADGLLAFKVGDGKYYVESGNGRLCYKVSITKDYSSCTCADYINKVKSEPSSVCSACSFMIASLCEDQPQSNEIADRSMQDTDQGLLA